MPCGLYGGGGGGGGGVMCPFCSPLGPALSFNSGLPKYISSSYQIIFI